MLTVFNNPEDRSILGFVGGFFLGGRDGGCLFGFGFLYELTLCKVKRLNLKFHPVSV